MHYIDVLQEALKQMPDRFTSQMFTREAIKKGYSERMIKNNGAKSFLHAHAVNDFRGSKTWTKKTVIKKKELDFSAASEFALEAMVETLKSHGYKVLKPVNEWVEL
jgi:superfamily I DNA and/or RNA helicase